MHVPARSRAGSTRPGSPPDLTRLVVEVEGVGPMDAVAGPDVPVRVGERVGLRLDPARCAVLDPG